MPSSIADMKPGDMIIAAWPNGKTEIVWTCNPAELQRAPDLRSAGEDIMRRIRAAEVEGAKLYRFQPPKTGDFLRSFAVKERITNEQSTEWIMRTRLGMYSQVPIRYRDDPRILALSTLFRIMSVCLHALATSGLELDKGLGIEAPEPPFDPIAVELF